MGRGDVGERKRRRRARRPSAAIHGQTETRSFDRTVAGLATRLLDRYVTAIYFPYLFREI